MPAPKQKVMGFASLDCVLIGNLATNPNKQELLARPVRHPEALALEVERAIAESIKDQDRRPPREMPMACGLMFANYLSTVS
jgi:hypothetical protein